MKFPANHEPDLDFGDLYAAYCLTLRLLMCVYIFMCGLYKGADVLPGQARVQLR